MAGVSVVIPTRDTRELTLRCVRSLRSAGETVREIVVVDDGGSDGTAEALGELDAGIAVLANERSEGFTRAANRGVAATSGEIVLLLNSDTEVDPGALAEFARAFAADPRLGIAGATLRYPDGTAQWSSGPIPTLPWLFAMASGLGAALHRVPGYRRGRRPGAVSFERRRAASWVTGAAMAIRRAVWNSVGPFDECFVFYAQDLDLCERAGKNGWGVALLPEARVVHHHGATVSRGESAALRHDPRLLWSDLVRWAEKSRGPRYAAYVASVLRAGARCRLLARALASPFVGATRRAELAANSRALRQALAEPASPTTSR